MIQNCTQCSAQFEITDNDLKFYDDISPIFNGKKETIPPPTFCPDCRQQRRMMMRNSSKLYHRKSDLSGKQIVSIYSADKPYKVYDQEEWWSDQWDPLAYGRDFDFSRNFTEQLSELSLLVPRISLNTTNTENSYYTNHTLNVKNSYLLFGGGNDEDCLFGNYVSNSKDAVDALSLNECEWCYEGIASQDCNRCMYFMDCRNCTECLFVEECQSCNDCILCFGLNRKEHCFMNEYLGKEGMEKKRKEIGELTPQTIAVMRRELEALKARSIHRQSHIFGSENCTGDMIANSKDCKHCFDISDCENCTYVSFTPRGHNSHDATFTSPEGVEWDYEVCSTVGCPSSMATFMVWYGDRIYYSMHCHHCKDCFGCVGLKQKQYCILNKQYTKEEYEALVPKIIDHMRSCKEWGEYLHPSLSAFGYNEMIAAEYFPMTKEQVEARGWKWHTDEREQENYMGPVVEPPATISQTTDYICQQILRCEITGKPFKIIPQELKFYRAMQIPIPRKCPEQRHKERMEHRNPRKLWKRNCSKCGKEMETTYSPERTEIVYCESCYLETVY